MERRVTEEGQRHPQTCDRGEDKFNRESTPKYSSLFCKRGNLPWLAVNLEACFQVACALFTGEVFVLWDSAIFQLRNFLAACRCDIERGRLPIANAPEESAPLQARADQSGPDKPNVVPRRGKHKNAPTPRRRLIWILPQSINARCRKTCRS